MPPGGRSTGCRTCRMRHLKCDEARPTCQRCAKAGMECRGYDVIDIFVDERSRIQERGSKSKAGRNASDAGVGNRSKAAARASGKNSPAATVSPISPIAPASSRGSPDNTARGGPPLAVPVPLATDDVFLNYLRHKIFQRPKIVNAEFRVLIATSSQAAAAPRVGWLVPALAQTELRPPLEPALNALSRAWFGKLEVQPDVAAEGMMQYGKALSELKIALSNERWRERDVLICAMCLILYESLLLTGENAWINHARGLGLLVEAQGPESFQDLTGLGILRAVRVIIIMSTLTRGLPTFLEKEEWREIPWQKYPCAKDDNDRLFEILARAPGMVHEINKWEADRSVDPTPIYDAITNSLRELCQWRWKYEKEHPNCAWIEDILDEEPSEMFPKTIHFATLFDAHVIGHFGALLILLLWLASRLNLPDTSPASMIPPLPVSVRKYNPLILPGVDELNPVAIAREVCQMIRFRTEFAAANSDNAVAFTLFMPSRMAWFVLQDFPLECQWLEGISNELERNTGLQFTKLVFWGR